MGVKNERYKGDPSSDHGFLVREVEENGWLQDEDGLGLLKLFHVFQNQDVWWKSDLQSANEKRQNHVYRPDTSYKWLRGRWIAKYSPLN